MTEVLYRRALNRATLARQLLLDRHALPALDAVHRLAGLNAQTADEPYLGLWSRLVDFRPAELVDLLHDRQVVRSCLMRCTQHLVTAADFAVFRPLLAPLLARTRRSVFGRRTDGVDLEELVARTEEHLRGRTLTRPELALLLAERWPNAERSALAWSAQYLTPIVHPPPDGVWRRRRGRTPFALAADWLGAPGEAVPSELIRRYLAAFGPATVRDLHRWSGLSRLGGVVESMDLRRFRTEGGVALFDLPDAPRPDADTPAPARLLPDFDNLALAHHGRTRVMSDEYRARICVGDAVAATILVDGVVVGSWRLVREPDTTTVHLTLFAPVTDVEPVVSEAYRLLAFAAPDTTHSVTY